MSSVGSIVARATEIGANAQAIGAVSDDRKVARITRASEFAPRSLVSPVTMESITSGQPVDRFTPFHKKFG
jgi:hypothetical protein